MAKIPTKDEWSTKKTSTGADKLVRDQWHISKHLEDYHKLPYKEFAKRMVLLTDLKSKFGKYKVELTAQDKKKTCATLVTDIDSIVKKIDKEFVLAKSEKGAEEGSTDAMKEQCDAHLELRKKVLVIVTDTHKQMRESLDSVRQNAGGAETASGNAKKSKLSNNIDLNQQSISLAGRFHDEAKDIYDKALAIEAEVITKASGKVVRSRLDGPITLHQTELGKVDANYVANHKRDSGAAFAAANKLTNEINVMLQEMKALVARAKVASEEAEANTMGTVNLGKLMETLKATEAEAASLKKSLEDSEEKMVGMDRRIGEVLEDQTMTKQQQHAKLKLTHEKQFLERVKMIGEKKSSMETILRRAELAPEKTGDNTFDVYRAKVVFEARKIPPVYKRLMESIPVINQKFIKAIASVST